MTRFRKLLNDNKLGEALLAQVGKELQVCVPKMHQTKKGQQWYFGVKLPIGVDSQKEPIVSKAPKARDFTKQRSGYAGAVGETVRARSRNKSRIRALAEHAFGVVKRLWAFARFAFVACRRTPCGRSGPWHWPISTSVAIA